MSDLLSGAYSDEVEKFTVVDCRYPYEFKGGHIEGALNIYTREDIYAEFMKSDQHRQKSSDNKRHIVIFHCEFSSERGPKMSRFLRESDREANKECYPELHYPELYLLEGGYKAFYEQHKVRRHILICSQLTGFLFSGSVHAANVQTDVARGSWR
jgi:rhodanese-related sulfurtransferase